MFLQWLIEENAHRGGILAHFYRPGGGAFELFCLPGEVGNLPIKKIAWGMVRTGIDWYISLTLSVKNLFRNVMSGKKNSAKNFISQGERLMKNIIDDSSS